MCLLIFKVVFQLRVKGYSPLYRGRHGGRLLCGDRIVQLVLPACISAEQEAGKHGCSPARRCLFSRLSLCVALCLGGWATMVGFSPPSSFWMDLAKRKEKLVPVYLWPRFISHNVSWGCWLKWKSPFSLWAASCTWDSFGSGHSSSPESSRLSVRSAMLILAQHYISRVSSTYTSANSHWLNTPWPLNATSSSLTGSTPLYETEGDKMKNKVFFCSLSGKTEIASELCKVYCTLIHKALAKWGSV